MAIVYTLRLKHYVDAFTITSPTSLTRSHNTQKSKNLAIGSRSLSFSLVKHCPADIVRIVVECVGDDAVDAQAERKCGMMNNKKEGASTNRKGGQQEWLFLTVEKVALKFIKLFRSMCVLFAVFSIVITLVTFFCGGKKNKRATRQTSQYYISKENSSVQNRTKNRPQIGTHLHILAFNRPTGDSAEVP